MLCHQQMQGCATCSSSNTCMALLGFNTAAAAQLPTAHSSCRPTDPSLPLCWAAVAVAAQCTHQLVLLLGCCTLLQKSSWCCHAAQALCTAGQICTVFICMGSQVTAPFPLCLLLHLMLPWMPRQGPSAGSAATALMPCMPAGCTAAIWLCPARPDKALQCVSAVGVRGYRLCTTPPSPATSVPGPEMTSRSNTEK